MKTSRYGWLACTLAMLLGSPSHAQKDPPAYKPPEGIAFRKETVVSEGTRLAAEVFSPKETDGKALPTIVMCHGWGGVAANLRADAEAFARAGYLVVVFDYRGWGASEGKLVATKPLERGKPGEPFTAEVKEVREVVDPLDQTTDLQNVIHWVHGEKQCDVKKIGLWGSSYSGGHVVHAAARDPRVKATVSQVPGMDSRFVLLGPGRKQTLDDATKRARGELAYPEAGKVEVGNLRGAPVRERLMNYAPVEDADKAPNCAMLFIVAEKEELFDNKDHGIKAHDRAKGPKKLVTIPGITHYGVYREARGQCQKLAIGWFDEHLKGERPPADTPKGPGAAADPNDWPTYNRDVIGSRHNPAEKRLSKDNVADLVEKWRFPPEGSKETIGVVHGTPVVVNGCVYFGTETSPTFYKLTPDGKVKWTYPPRGEAKPDGPRPEGKSLPVAGFVNSPLVTDDAVYVGDVAGTVHALDRATGQLRWQVGTRAKPFPAAHPSNCVFSAPILADGLIVVGGGAYEHAVAADPKNTGCTGRGLVFALDPATGKVVWVYAVGPEPKEFDKPVTIKDSWGERTYLRGPSTSSVWCTPSYDAESHTIFFGTDCHNSPKEPTKDDPGLSTKHSCAVIAVDARTGAEKWVTQINPDDVWSYALRGYDPDKGRYKDQSVGDTPKIYTIDVDGKPRKVVGCGCKNGGFYVFDAATGKLLNNTPVYTGPPVHPPPAAPDLNPRTLALPGTMGGLQTGCATDGKAVYTNGIDILRLGTGEKGQPHFQPPTGGRVASISLDAAKENWRHERPKVAAVGGTKEKPAFTDVGDPVASGIALANGVAYFTTVVSNKLVAVDVATGKSLKEIDLGRPVWCGPSVSRGRVYVGTGNLLFAPGFAQEAYFPKSATGSVHSFGLTGEDEVSRMKAGDE